MQERDWGHGRLGRGEQEPDAGISAISDQDRITGKNKKDANLPTCRTKHMLEKVQWKSSANPERAGKKRVKKKLNKHRRREGRRSWRGGTELAWEQSTCQGVKME